MPFPTNYLRRQLMCALLLFTPSQTQGLSKKTMYSLEISTKTTRCYTVCAILITLASWYCHQRHHSLPRLLNSEILNTVIFGVMLGNYRQLKLVRTFRKTQQNMKSHQDATKRTANEKSCIPHFLPSTIMSVKLSLSFRFSDQNVVYALISSTSRPPKLILHGIGEAITQRRYSNILN